MKFRDGSLTVTSEKTTYDAIIEELQKTVEQDRSAIIEKLLVSEKIFNRILIQELEGGNVERVKMLFRSGVKKDVNDNLPIKIAAEKGYVEIVELIIKKSYDKENLIKTTGILGTAAKNGHIEIVKLICGLTDFEGNEIKRAFRKELDEALEEAAENGHIEIVKFLIEQSCFISDKAIILAAQNGYIEIMKLFIEEGKSVGTTYGGKNLYEIAAEKGNIELVDFLIKKDDGGCHLKFYYGVRTSSTTEYMKQYRESAIYAATKNGRTDIVELLRKKQK